MTGNASTNIPDTSANQSIISPNHLSALIKWPNVIVKSSEDMNFVGVSAILLARCRSHGHPSSSERPLLCQTAAASAHSLRGGTQGPSALHSQLIFTGRNTSAGEFWCDFCLLVYSLIIVFLYFLHVHSRQQSNRIDIRCNKVVLATLTSHIILLKVHISHMDVKYSHRVSLFINCTISTFACNGILFQKCSFSPKLFLDRYINGSQQADVPLPVR